jgi:hypothetical protein
MSSSRVRNVLLVTFIVLTLIFGSLFVYEFIQVQQVKSPPPTTYTVTATITTPTTITSTVAETTYSTTHTVTITTSKLPDEGTTSLNNGEDYTYKRLENFDEGETITFKNVSFTNLIHNATETYLEPVFFIKVAYTDGFSQVLTVWINPFASRPLMYFTDHSPKAGVIISNENSLIVLYLIVEET